MPGDIAFDRDAGARDCNERISFTLSRVDGTSEFFKIVIRNFIGTVKSTPTERVLQATAVTFEPITMTVRKSSPAMIPS